MAVTIRGFPRTVAHTVFPGGPAGTQFTIDGDLDAAGDTILSARHCSADLVTNADITANVTITGQNKVTIAVTVTTGNFVVLTYAKASSA